MGGYDGWVARANNATSARRRAYDELVPGFEALFEREGATGRASMQAVKRLAACLPQGRSAGAAADTD